MKDMAEKKLFLGWAALLFTVLASPCHVRAQAGAPGAIFDFGANARPLGMGGAYVAQVRDATALYYNPGGLSMMNSRNLSLMHATLYEQMSYDYVGYGQNYSSIPGAWAVQFVKLAGGQAEGRDINNIASGNFTYSETALTLGTGIHGVFLPALSVGASFKMLNRALDNEATKLMGFDLGAQYVPLDNDKLSFGMVLRNFGSFATGDTADKLPFSAKAGAAYMLGRRLLIAADITGEGTVQVGTEYKIGPAALRLGYNRDSFTMGAGIKLFTAYQVDYAMVKHPELGLSNRISIAYYFAGVSAPPKIRSFAGDYLKKAGSNIDKRDYVSAYDYVDMSIGMDPSVKNGPWGETHKKLSDLIFSLKLRELPARQAMLIEDSQQSIEAGFAIKEFLNNNNDKSSLLAHSALGYQPGNAFFTDFLTIMSGLTHTEVRKDEILPRQALVISKLDKGSAAFYAQNFEKVVSECREVLLLDDRNVLAWKKLGSAYFATGNMAAAKRAYSKVLELDPNDDSVRKFMSLQGWR